MANIARIMPCEQPGYPFNVQIWTEIKGRYVYCGNGKFCRDINEVSAVCGKYSVIEREYPEPFCILDAYEDIDGSIYYEVLVAPGRAVTVKHNRPTGLLYIMDGEGGEIHEVADPEKGTGFLTKEATNEILLLVKAVARIVQ